MSVPVVQLVTQPLGLARGDLVAGEEIALRPLEAHAIHPHRRGGRAPDPGRRVAEARALARHDQVSFGTIAGWSRALTIPVGVIGPVLAGWIYDTTGSYEIAFQLFAVTLAISVVIMLFVKPPTPPRVDPSPGYDPAAAA